MLLQYYCIPQSNTHDWSSSHIKRHFQCVEQQVSWTNLTKYCTCYAKRLTCWILITYETLFTMRGTTGVPLQHHQILHLPRKIPFVNFLKNLWKQIKRHFQCEADPSMKPSVRNPLRKWGDFSSLPQTFSTIKYNISPATKNNTCISPNTMPATKSDTSTSPRTAPATQKHSHT